MDSSGLTPFFIRHQALRDIMNFQLTEELLKINRFYIPNDLCVMKSTEKRVDPRIPAAFIQNLSDMNILIDNATLSALYNLRADKAEVFLEHVYDVLKARYGVWGYSVMYPNFPRQVMDADATELFYNAYAHYLTSHLADFLDDTSLVWLPRFNKANRPRLSERTTYTLFRFVNNQELQDKTSHNLLNSPVALSQDNLNLLKLLVQNRLIYNWTVIPPFKEIRAVFQAEAVKYFTKEYESLLNWEEMTTTDVLRFAVAYQGGDVSLASPHHFRTFPRSIRRWIMTLLDNMKDAYVGFVVRDMQSHRGMWIGLAEMIHSGEFHAKFPFAYAAIAHLRSKEFPKSWAGLVDEALNTQNYKKLLSLLEDRPGEFARRLNYLAQRVPPEQHRFIIRSFSNVVHSVPTRILYQIQSFYLNLFTQQKHRIFFPKGQVSKVYYKPNNLLCSYLDKDEYVTPYFSFWNQIQSRVNHSLHQRCHSLSKLGKVWVDPALENIAIPMSQRSASDGLMQLERCSRFSLEKKKDTIRFFIHWKEPEGKRTDVDLSVVFYNENLEFVEQVFYRNLRSDYCWHSGDIVSAPNGATECIDLSIEKAIANGAAYAIPSVNLFSGENFDQLPVAQFGWMTRARMQDGEIFEPKTVQNCFNLRSPNRIILPAIIDLRKKEVIWLDLGMNSAYWINNVSTQQNKIRNLFEYFINKKVVSMSDVLKMHGRTRGQLVLHQHEADTIFDLETSKDLIKFSTDFLS